MSWLNGKEHVLTNDKEWITSHYGYRTDPITGKTSAYHGGIDLVDGKTWAPVDVKTIAAGKVVTVVNNITWSYASTKSLVGISSSWYHGCHVIIDHTNGFTSTYKHLAAQSIKVKVGDAVSKGTPLALMGTTGYSTGNHLHFEIARNGARQDPAPYLKGSMQLPDAVKTAIDILVRKGFINTPAYWVNNYKNVVYLDLLIMRSADILNRPCDTVTQIDIALRGLVVRGVINSPEYWRANYKQLEFLEELLLRLGGAR